MLRVVLPVVALATAAAALADPVRDRVYPAPTAPLSLAELPAGVAFTEVTTADGLRLKGLEVAGDAAKPVLLLFHGNGSSAADALGWFRPLLEQGYGAVAAEYRGYSANPGAPSETGLAADADAFLARARALANGRRVIVVGHSLGGGVAFGLATRNRLDALVTIGTFTRLRAMAPKLARAFIRDRYDNLAAVPALDEPFHLVHGAADDVVSADMGEALHQAAVKAGKPGASWLVQAAGHVPDIAVIGLAIEAAARPGAPLPAPPAGVRVFAR